MAVWLTVGAQVLYRRLASRRRYFHDGPRPDPRVPVRRVVRGGLNLHVHSGNFFARCLPHRTVSALDFYTLPKKETKQRWERRLNKLPFIHGPAVVHIYIWQKLFEKSVKLVKETFCQHESNCNFYVLRFLAYSYLE